MGKDATRYVVVMDGKPGAYGIWVPDMRGCFSMGDTVPGVLRNAQEALRMWAEDVLSRGGQVPPPRGIEEITQDADVKEDISRGSALAIVPLIIDAGRPVKANLSLDAGLLAAIDEAAKARGLTRSAFLASAAREKILAEG